MNFSHRVAVQNQNGITDHVRCGAERKHELLGAAWAVILTMPSISAGHYSDSVTIQKQNDTAYGAVRSKPVMRGGVIFPTGGNKSAVELYEAS